MAKRRSKFSGDKRATVAKAKELLKFAREELNQLPQKGDLSPRQQARLRQAADKTWSAVTTAADAFLLKTTGKTAKSKTQVADVYSGKDAAKFAHVYSSLHIACAYEDDPTICTVPRVKEQFREAGQIIHSVALKLSKK